VDEILRQLAPGARILDLGSQRGSFARPLHRLTVRLDLEGAPDVRADAAHLPFADHSFDAIIANHSLEHFTELDAVLAEIARTLRPAGLLFVSVPDASTLSDRIYRWLARGGGHVNPFTSAPALIARIAAATGSPFAGGRYLFSSFSFLNQQNLGRAYPRRMILFANGSEPFLRWFSYLLRRLHPRWALYGWALYFGPVAEEIGAEAWTNACIRCGSGHPEQWLVPILNGRRYACPACGAVNLFTRDRSFTSTIENCPASRSPLQPNQAHL
jgi:SAM-dependent methyltransferase